MAVLLPIRSTKRITARRVRQRIWAVMKWAVAKGYRQDDPTGDAISAALPNNRVASNHQRALPHAGVGTTLARVRRGGLDHSRPAHESRPRASRAAVAPGARSPPSSCGTASTRSRTRSPRRSARTKTPSDTRSRERLRRPPPRPSRPQIPHPLRRPGRLRSAGANRRAAR